MQWLPYVLGAITVLFVVMQVRPLLAGRRMQGKPAPDFTALLEPEQRGHARYLLFFHSEHCGPCRAMRPHIETLSGEFPGQVIPIDVQQAPALAQDFGVMATPTSLLIQEGRIGKVLLGTQGLRRLQRLLGDAPAGHDAGP